MFKVGRETKEVENRRGDSVARNDGVDGIQDRDLIDAGKPRGREASIAYQIRPGSKRRPAERAPSPWLG